MEFNTNTNDEENTVGNQKESPMNRNVFRCVQCNLEFSKYTTFKRHINSHEIDPHQKGLQCKYCSKYWSSVTSLRRHIRIHTGN